MGLNNSIMDDNVRNAKNGGESESVSSDAPSIARVVPSTVDLMCTSQHQLSGAALGNNTCELPSQINKIDLNLVVPNPLGKYLQLERLEEKVTFPFYTSIGIRLNISDEEFSEDEEENECLLQL